MDTMIDLSGAVIVVTGGTGSFGNEFVERVVKTWPDAVVRVFSRDEQKQAQMRDRFLARNIQYVLGDVRDYDRTLQALRGADVVVHAAAMKQVPECEGNPVEAVRTNVLGTYNVVRASIEVGAKRFVMLSTDKAVHPAGVYGATKLCAEKIVVQGNIDAGGRPRLASVRNGNFVDSRGSVIPVFREQLSRRGRISVTDERMTRFWITLPQAVDTVLYALDNMEGGEVFVPKLPSMSVVTLARAMLPKGTEIEYIGIRPGEKLHETLITVDEARNTRDAGDVFVVLSDGRRMSRWNGADRVPPEFVYSSDENSEWLSVSDMMAFVGES